ncbi:MAG: ATP-binding protein [Deltaproteobacteria bacterium]
MRIFWRQFLSGCLIISAVLSLFTILAIGEIKEFDRALTRERLVTSANLLGEILKTPLFDNQTAQIQAAVSRIGSIENMRITIIAVDGAVIAESDKPDPRGLENHARRPEVIASIATGIGESIRHSRTVDKDMFYVALPVRDAGGSVRAVVRTALPLSSIEEAFAAIRSKVIYIALALMILALALSYAASEASAKSLERLIGVSEEIARGDFSASIPTSEFKGEMGKLAGALKTMADDLKDLFHQVSLEKAQLKAVLGAMSEGVIVISGEGQITLVNQALAEMFDIKSEPLGKAYWEVLRNREIVEIVESALRGRICAKREFSLFYPAEKYYLANAIPLDSGEREVIIVIFDITEFKRLEKIKADLIGNVSHELRTPLTAIKGYVETLQEGEETRDERMHFLGIVKRNTDRLINIVADLLVLSEVENRDSLWRENPRSDFEDVNFREIVSSALDALRSKINDKNLLVSSDVSGGLPRFNGNRFLLEQMFINLIDNAVKYTPEGGSIGVSVAKQVSDFKIEVTDTGIGIPKEHLPRIFERFYRVDKTRSRKQGGTGLGLSIVKHICMMHDGKIAVQSEGGRGSRFIITLPT